MKIYYSKLCKKGQKYDVCEDYVSVPEENSKYGITGLDIDKLGLMFVVCDGMGGGNAGEIASELCANWFMKGYYAENVKKGRDLLLKKLISSTNLRLYKLSKEHDSYSGMGTTLTSLLIYSDKAYVNSVGDSRAYLFTEKLEQLTQDHSEVWDLYKKGYIEKDDIIKSEKKHIINQTMAYKKNVNINSSIVKVPSKFLFLLCSDGLTDVMTDSEIEEILLKSDNLDTINWKLYEHSQLKGSRDDVSIVLVSDYLVSETYLVYKSLKTKSCKSRAKLDNKKNAFFIFLAIAFAVLFIGFYIFDVRDIEGDCKNQEEYVYIQVSDPVRMDLEKSFELHGLEFMKTINQIEKKFNAYSKALGFDISEVDQVDSIEIIDIY